VPETLVPDTSVLVDGRITELVQSDYPGAKVLVSRAAFAELERQANRGLETGVTGLDELANLQKLSDAGKIKVEFIGERPTFAQLKEGPEGTVDALIRDAAVHAKGLYVTSDRVSAHAAAAQGIRHHYVRPIVREVPDLTHLKLWSYFDAQTMSVHLKSDCIPMVKKGRPGQVVYQPVGQKEMAHQDLRLIIRECLEFAKRDYNSFTEMEKAGCTVLQVGPMRITIAQPPFADGVELTAVRPITKKRLEEYGLPKELLDRIEGKSRGVFIAGPPGSGKSTFAAAAAEHLHEQGRVVKTMEQPRDLQVPKEITQYGALDGDMRFTGEITLLVRPDNVVYDEVRTTEDFQTFADMRLAGVGLLGVTHANRAIDAVQRLIGRIDLGMIPQVVDTVLFVEAGAIAQVLELEFTVKVPEGMTQEDLARPVVVVRDVMEGREVYELYSFGEQVVVMPLDQARGNDPHSKETARALESVLKRYIHGQFEVSAGRGKATIYVDPDEVPVLIGKGGRTVQSLERKLGVRLDIKARTRPMMRPDSRPAPMQQRPDRMGDDEGRGGTAGEGAGGKPRGAAAVPRVRMKKTSTNVFLLVEGAQPGKLYRVLVEGQAVGEAVTSNEGRLRFKSNTGEGDAIIQAEKRGLVIDVEPIDS
jgi:ATPase